jgi:hypothetical protein
MGLNFLIYEHSMNLQTKLLGQYSLHPGSVATTVISGFCGAMAGGKEMHKSALELVLALALTICVASVHELLQTTCNRITRYSLLSGVSKLLMFPLDTIKKRLQAQVLFNTVHDYTHSVDATCSHSAARVSHASSTCTSSTHDMTQQHPTQQTLRASTTNTRLRSWSHGHDVVTKRRGGVVPCVQQIYSREGIGGFYKVPVISAFTVGV